MQRTKTCSDNVISHMNTRNKIACHVVINMTQRLFYAPPIHFYVLPINCIYVFLWISKQRLSGIILLFKIQGQCVTARYALNLLNIAQENLVLRKVKSFVRQYH
jgi:hypothetical protein